MIELDYNTWFTNRELTEQPIHFVKATAPVTHNSMIWVKESLRGRFYVLNLAFTSADIYFEDPAESLFYDLKWS